MHMKKVRLTKGTNIFDWCFIPTIRFDNSYREIKYLTIEWLKWYVGIKWEV